jgi:uncharacterized protein
MDSDNFQALKTKDFMVILKDNRPRIPGFDLARAWAIFGMFIVNFQITFGNFTDQTPMNRFLNLFTGNSSAAFVILAGMGVSLLTFRPEAEAAEKKRLQKIVLNRSWFLFALGLLLYPWWPGDILHFYGGYMHLAAFFLFVNNRWLLGMVAFLLAGFHLLLFVIPYETGWDFERFVYLDFWTIPGFLRNTIYNGWNPIFPWAAFFFLGMWLGRLQWQLRRVKIAALKGALLVFLPLEALMFMAGKGAFSPDVTRFLLSDYVPPFLPFMLSCGSAAVLLIVICLWLGERFEASSLAKTLAATGQMTLTHYVIHLTLGMLTLSVLTGQPYGLPMNPNGTASPTYILMFSAAWFLGSMVFSYLWKKRFEKGPVEMLMRRLTG